MWKSGNIEEDIRILKNEIILGKLFSNIYNINF